jgi:hypothetical protein
MSPKSRSRRKSFSESSRRKGGTRSAAPWRSSSLEYGGGPRGLRIVRVAGGFGCKPVRARQLDRSLFRHRNRVRLSRAALETLAIIAYRQPVTGPEIQSVRGANPIGVLQTLLERKLIRTLGRKKVVGKPILYGTTEDFLTPFRAQQPLRPSEPRRLPRHGCGRRRIGDSRRSGCPTGRGNSAEGPEIRLEPDLEHAGIPGQMDGRAAVDSPHRNRAGGWSSRG